MLFQTKLRRLFLSVLFVFFVGCGPKKCGALTDVAPEDQLRNYIDLAVNIITVEQREELEGLTTGELKDTLTSLSADAFKVSYLDRRYEFDEFEILGKTEIEANKTTEIEYRVKFRSWLTGEDKTRAPVQEIKSIATLKYTQGHWAIAEIKPIDTDFNWDVGLPLDGVSTRGVILDEPGQDVLSIETDAQMQEGQGEAQEGQGEGEIQ
jgi:hypothetical protein